MYRVACHSTTCSIILCKINICSTVPLPLLKLACSSLNLLLTPISYSVNESNFCFCYWVSADFIYNRIYLHICYRVIRYRSIRDFLNVFFPSLPSILANPSVIKFPHLSFTAFVVLHLSLLRVFVIAYTSFILPLLAASSASMARWSTHFLLSCLHYFFVFTPIFIHVILLNPV